MPGGTAGYRLEELGAEREEEATGALVGAFMTDPLMTFIVPDERQRRRWLPIAMRELVRFSRKGGRSRVAVDSSGRVTATLAVGAYPPPLAAQLRNLIRGLLLPTPWEPNLRHLLKIFRYMSAWEAMHLRTPHHYVYVIGVAPEHQHRGLGRRLMRDLIKRSDAEGIPVYLETQTESNVPFYEALDFKVTEMRRPSPEGPPVWAMLRPVRAHGE